MVLFWWIFCWLLFVMGWFGCLFGICLSLWLGSLWFGLLSGLLVSCCLG